MSRSQAINALEQTRGQKLELLEDLHEKAATESRLMTPLEAAKFDAAMAAVEEIDAQLLPLRREEKLAALHAVPIGNLGGYFPVSAEAHYLHDAPLNKKGEPKGTAFTRYCLALAAGRGNLGQSLEYAKTAYSKSNPELLTILKAAVAAGTTTDPQWAGPLVAYRDMQDEFIELLRPATIIGRMDGFRRVPFNVRIPRQTVGASVGWVGEGLAKPVTKLAFDAITMPFSKIAGIIAITEELARLSSPSAEELVRRDLVATIAQFMDTQFVDPTIAPDAATHSPGSVTYGAETIPSSGTDMAAISADLAAMLTAVVTNGFPLEGLAWIMNSKTKISLSNLRTSQDLYAYPTLAASGTLLGYPVIDSASVPITAGTPPTTFIALVVPGEILLADEGQTVLDSSREAALAMSDDGTGSLVSLWQNNLIGIRAERFVHWMRRRDGAVIVLTGVEY